MIIQIVDYIADDFILNEIEKCQKYNDEEDEDNEGKCTYAPEESITVVAPRK